MLNLSCNLVGRSNFLLVLRIALVDGRCVDVLIIVSLQAEAAFILGELIPRYTCRLRSSSGF
jgi:hypothetical protein